MASIWNQLIIIILAHSLIDSKAVWKYVGWVGRDCRKCLVKFITHPTKSKHRSSCCRTDSLSGWSRPRTGRSSGALRSSRLDPWWPPTPGCVRWRLVERGKIEKRKSISKFVGEEERKCGFCWENSISKSGIFERSKNRSKRLATGPKFTNPRL